MNGLPTRVTTSTSWWVGWACNPLPSACHPGTLTRLTPVTPDGKRDLASLLAYDAIPATRLHLERSAKGIAGRVSDTAGQPLAGRLVTLALLATQPQMASVLRGTVPNGTTSAIVGLRVNTECQCSGANDIVIGRIVFTEESPNAQRRDTDVDLAQTLRRLPGGRVRPYGDASVRVTATPSQQVLANAKPLVVTPGAHFLALGRGHGPSSHGIVRNLDHHLDRDGRKRAQPQQPRYPAILPGCSEGRDGRERRFRVRNAGRRPSPPLPPLSVGCPRISPRHSVWQ